MKDLSELHLPDDVRYSEDHEWAKREGKKMRIGISDYAQDQLGDITFVEMPEVGDTFEKGEEFGTLESTKAVSEMLMPISGEIIAINEALEEEPGLVNGSPYGDGWIVAVKPEDPSEFETLMSRDEYLKMLEGLD